jgi:hypothetical protein
VEPERIRVAYPAALVPGPVGLHGAAVYLQPDSPLLWPANADKPPPVAGQARGRCARCHRCTVRVPWLPRWA